MRKEQDTVFDKYTTFLFLLLKTSNFLSMLFFFFFFFLFFFFWMCCQFVIVGLYRVYGGYFGMDRLSGRFDHHPKQRCLR